MAEAPLLMLKLNRIKLYMARDTALERICGEHSSQFCVRAAASIPGDMAAYSLRASNYIWHKQRMS